MPAYTAFLDLVLGDAPGENPVERRAQVGDTVAPRSPGLSGKISKRGARGSRRAASSWLPR